MHRLVQTMAPDSGAYTDARQRSARAEWHLTVPRDWRRPANPRAWRIVFGHDRLFGQVHPRPSQREIASFYDIDAYYTHAERAAPDPASEARQVGSTGRVLASLAYRFDAGREPTGDWWRSVIPESATDALEIGCGDGDRMRTLEPLLSRVRGVEPDPRAVRVARDARGLDVYQGTAESLPDAVKDREYGLIVFWHVLEHTLDPVSALRNAASLLAEDGVMAIEVPNNGCDGARMMGAAWRWLDVPRHLNFFTTRSLQKCAEVAGLRVIDTQYRGYVRQFLPDWILDEATIRARLAGREATRQDVRIQLGHAARLLTRTALAPADRKYDSVRILCKRA